MRLFREDVLAATEHAGADVLARSPGRECVSSCRGATTITRHRWSQRVQVTIPVPLIPGLRPWSRGLGAKEAASAYFSCALTTR